MSWVMLSLRKMALRQRISDFEMKSVQISQRIMDLQSYGNNIADGVITYSELATCPSSLFGTQMGFMADSSQVAYQSAQIKTDAALAQMQALQDGTGGQYNYTSTNINPAYANPEQAYLLFNEIYKEELEEYSKEITAQLNQEEKELQTEKDRVETQLKAAEAELENLQNSIDQNIKNDAIKLA